MTESPANSANHHAQWEQVRVELLKAIDQYEDRVLDDVAQMNAVIQDAIQTLVAAYQSLERVVNEAHATVPTQDGTAGQGAPVTSGAPSQTGTTAARTALQFEDVLSQLLQRMVERCASFGPLPILLAHRLVEAAQAGGPDVADEAMRQDVRGVLASVQQQVDEIQKHDIGQRSMDAGTVELF
jgi:hypothetical protein